jgi:hypothetical protein
MLGKVVEMVVGRPQIMNILKRKREKCLFTTSVQYFVKKSKPFIRDFWYIWEKYQSSEITSGITFKINLPLYKGFTLKITYNGDRWPHWTGDCYIELKNIAKCTGKAWKWLYVLINTWNVYHCRINTISLYIHCP